MYALLIAVAAMIGITIFGSCSADGDFWGFDNEYASSENTRSEVKDMSEYLTLSSYDFTKWTDEDYAIIGKAIERMNITLKNERYVPLMSSAKAINVSDSLYITTLLSTKNC